MPKIVTPVSNLFKTIDSQNLIIDLSDSLECRDHTIDFNLGLPEVFHCEIQPIHTISDQEFEYLSQIRNKKKNLKLVSFHAASCYSAPVIVDGIFQPGGKRYAKGEMLNLAKQNLRRIKNIFGKDVKIAIENNNFYATQAYEVIADPDFISSVVNDNNIHFLFDIAHAKISAHNKGVTYEFYKSGLPMDKCIQLHICKFDINDSNLAYDAHLPPDKTEFDEIKELLKDSGIEYLTIEYYKELPILVNALKELRKLL